MIYKLFLEDLSLWSCMWQSTLFAGLGLICSYLLRRRPARASQVLFLAMIAAIILPVMSLSVKHYELGLFAAELDEQPPAMGDIIAYRENNFLPSIETSITESSEMQDFDYAEESPASVGISWRKIMLYGWVMATIIMLTRLFAAFINEINILRRAQSRVCGSILRSADIAKEKLGISDSLRILGTRDIQSPVIWCWSSNPILMVPEDLENRVDWVGVFCHELAHWKRRDHLTGLIAELIVCLLPWNPLLWWSKKRMIGLSEQACDDWVAGGSESIEDYAQSLLNFKPRRRAAIVPAVVYSKKSLANRIRRILKENCINPRVGAGWALVVSILAICVTIGVAFAQTRPPKPVDVTTISEDKSLSEFEDKDLIVQKLFKLKHYSPSQMARVIMPLISKSGYVSTNKENASLLVIDTVENLITIERIINQFDVSTEPQNHEIIMVFEVHYKDPSEVIKSLWRLINGQTSTDSSISALSEPRKRRILLVPEQKHNRIIVRASSEDVNLIRKWIEKLDCREPDANALPESWSLYYDNGFTSGGRKRWPTNMAKNLASLDIVPRPFNISDESWKNERFGFDICMLNGTRISDLSVKSGSEFSEKKRIIFQPDKYQLTYTRGWGKPGNNFRMNCGPFLLDLSRPGIYNLQFSPKLGEVVITGSAGGCYAVNFEKIDKGFPIHGFAYINREKEYTLDGLLPGTYRLSAVTQRQSDNVFISQAEVTVKSEEKVTVDIKPPSKGDCSLKGVILGRQKVYSVDKPVSHQSRGEWFILIRKPGSGKIVTTFAYEARTMDSLYVVRGNNITQDTNERASYKIEGIVAGEYTVTAIEHPRISGLVITRQQSKSLIIKAGQEAVLDFDLR